MDVLHRVCVGIDVHRDKLAVCLHTASSKKRPPRQPVFTFSTFADDLQRLRSFVLENKVTAVAMEATGIYWKPVYAALEGCCELYVANAQHIKGLAGRKTDVLDSQWIAQLCSHGMVTKSFVPDLPIRELQQLARARALLAQERATLINRLHKLLDQQGNKLGSVVSDLQGTSAKEILRRLAAGETDAASLAESARSTLRQRKDELARALSAPLSKVSRRQLQHFLRQWDLFDELLVELDQDLDQHSAPYQSAIERMCEIPGVGELTARKIIAEIGADMTAFPTPEQLASWAGVCPGNHESAGKKKSGKTRAGNKFLKTALIEAAMAAARSRGTYLKKKYFQLKSRRGAKKAAMAVGHKILKIVWHLLSNPEARYRELGEGYVDKRHEDKVVNQLVKRLQAMGRDVTVSPKKSREVEESLTEG